MQRKFLTVVMLLLVGAMVLSACAVPTPAGQEPTAAEPTAAAMEEPMGESYTDVDPTGQTVVWWHNHSGSREEGLLGLIEQFNSSNEYGITVDAQNLFNIAKVLPDATAHLNLGAQNRLEVTSGSAWYKVVGLPADRTEVPSELLSGARPGDPFGSLFMQELREQLVQALTEMPERLRLVMSLYYYNDLNFKEIGRVLDLTESRISQLHTQAVAWLRKRLSKAT